MFEHAASRRKALQMARQLDLFPTRHRVVLVPAAVRGSARETREQLLDLCARSRVNFRFVFR